MQGRRNAYDRRRPSGLESAVEMRLREKHTGQLENLVGRRSSLTSRSRALIRSRSAVLTPSHSPRSTCSRLTQWSNVCGVQPIIGAIDSTAAHIDGCSLRYSRTKRTARSRTSGENLLGFLFVAPFSQELEPPPNPVWFIFLLPPIFRETSPKAHISLDYAVSAFLARIQRLYRSSR